MSDTILAIGLGRHKSVAYVHDPRTGGAVRVPAAGRNDPENRDRLT